MFKEFQQKIRNRPIDITDIAVSKVRCIQFEGFTSDENRIIQKQHQELLRISKDYNDSNEVGILVDIIHWNTWVIFGKGNEVETKDNPEAYKALKTYPKNTLLFMHNHPSTSTFSGTDFKTFCHNSSLYIITVVGNDGNIRVLEKLNNFDANYALQHYKYLAESKYANYENNGTLAMKEVLSNSAELGLHYKIGAKK